MVRIIPDAPAPEIEARARTVYVNIRPECPNPYAVAGFTVEGQLVTCSLAAVVELHAALGEAFADPDVAVLLAPLVAAVGETPEVRRDDAEPLGRAA